MSVELESLTKTFLIPIFVPSQWLLSENTREYYSKCKLEKLTKTFLILTFTPIPVTIFWKYFPLNFTHPLLIFQSYVCSNSYSSGKCPYGFNSHWKFLPAKNTPHGYVSLAEHSIFRVYGQWKSFPYFYFNPVPLHSRCIVRSAHKPTWRWKKKRETKVNEEINYCGL